ncbi:hypothetical protein ACQCT6_13100 [Cytobacillus gottheilii]|uniref:DUF2642 domain-containing protein n=1 Tax=Cytobacillus gottheilii TaxID=859144 RepID=A0ABX8F561_9BACI|nr:hypothetical protein [Cytobacillus gottheilii]QVY59653.1 hypothetical protein J1899_11270 [Cytobacillus gottheilii]
MNSTFRSQFIPQLSRYLGRGIEVITDNSYYDGVLVEVGRDFIELAETVPGYETQTRRSIVPIDAINYVRVPTLTA